MAVLTYKIEGLKELDIALGELPKATARNVLRRTLNKVSEPLVASAKQRAPDRSGTPPNDLRMSITTSARLNREQRRVTRGSDKAFAELHVGPDVSVPNDHGHWQEFGTVHHGPQPFMRPAFDATKMEMLAGIKDELWSEISKSAARQARKAARLAAKG